MREWFKSGCGGWKRHLGFTGSGKDKEEVELPLAMAEIGRKFKVCRVLGGKNLCGRLASMGIYPGVEMEIICGSCHGPCIVRVQNSTLSLGSGMAQKIMVKNS